METNSTSVYYFLPKTSQSDLEPGLFADENNAGRWLVLACFSVFVLATIAVLYKPCRLMCHNRQTQSQQQIHRRNAHRRRRDANPSPENDAPIDDVPPNYDEIDKVNHAFEFQVQVEDETPKEDVSQERSEPNHPPPNYDCFDDYDDTIASDDFPT